jgi:hypothetical protein
MNLIILLGHMKHSPRKKDATKALENSNPSRA